MNPVQPTSSPFESASNTTFAPRLDRPHEGANSDSSLDTLDPRLVQETKIQIRTIVNEISQLCQSDCEIDEFYDGFLTRVTSALASMGGSVIKVVAVFTLVLLGFGVDGAIAGYVLAALAAFILAWRFMGPVEGSKAPFGQCAAGVQHGRMFGWHQPNSDRAWG